MKEIELPEGQCPLCKLKDIKSIYIEGYGRARLYYCPNCKPYSITYMAYRFTPIIMDQDVCSKLSFYIRHNSSEENPVFVSKNDF